MPVVATAIVNSARNINIVIVDSIGDFTIVKTQDNFVLGSVVSTGAVKFTRWAFAKAS